MKNGTRVMFAAAGLCAMARLLPAQQTITPVSDTTRVDTVRISSLARQLASDSMRGRGPFTPENMRAARLLADELTRLGAVPVFGDRLLVPFAIGDNQRDTVFNVIGIIPGRGAAANTELIGITSHLDHKGVDTPDASGDSIYNGFLDAAVPMAIVLDVARRFAQSPGERSLLVLFFNLEEQGLTGAKALAARSDIAPLVSRMKLLIGIDAGSPLGEPLEWQLMGAQPSHRGAEVADLMARARGWSTSATAPRAISDVFVFSQLGVPILFPIPGRVWRGFSEAERSAAMAKFDHYHQPSDQWHPDWSWLGTYHFADWTWSIVSRVSLRSILP